MTRFASDALGSLGMAEKPTYDPAESESVAFSLPSFMKALNTSSLRLAITFFPRAGLSAEVSMAGCGKVAQSGTSLGCAGCRQLSGAAIAVSDGIRDAVPRADHIDPANRSVSEESTVQGRFEIPALPQQE
ncbi:hypothetical protein WJX74_008960 [Apatococcus lobatus]|uniref:Uncharacterized protein n=1 Tax=Apatococcus lobatus TaxID=904363 RepID=A0AAW1QUZ1_9CHLO